VGTARRRKALDGFLPFSELKPKHKKMTKGKNT